MKHIFSRLSTLLLTAGMLLFSAAPSSAQYQDGYDNGNGNDGYYDDGYDDYNNGNSYYQNFYNDLAPHGSWYNDPQYGYVWSPNAGSDFQPYYSNGYWMMTDYGNTWVSNYSWGWAPFHYGRWAHASYGWCWIPGNQWGPAWVSWRSGGGSYGWAPMGPGISVQASFGWNAPSAWWTFIPQGQIYNRGFHSYNRGPRYNNTYINQTTIINNTYINNRRTYVSGPGRRDLERAGVRTIPTYNVRDGRRPGTAVVNRNEVNFYRPSINRAPGGGRNGMNRGNAGTAPNSGGGRGMNNGGGGRGAGVSNGGGRGNTVPNGGGQPSGNPRGDFRNGQPVTQQPDPSRLPDNNFRPRGRFDSQPAQTQRPDFNNPAVGQPEHRDRGSWNRPEPQQQQLDRAQQQPSRGWNRGAEQPRAEMSQPAQPQRDRGWDRPAPQPQQDRGFNRPAPQPQAQPQQDRSFNRQERSDWNAQPQRQMNQPAPQSRPEMNNRQAMPERSMQRSAQPAGGGTEQRGGFRGRGR